MDGEDRLLDINRDLADWIEALQRSDQRLYNMMSIEFWAIARTMDNLEPGFWSQYMQNRQKIFQQHLRDRQQQQANAKSTPETASDTTASDNPENTEEVVFPDESEERTALFSEALDKDLARIRRIIRASEE